MGPKESWNRRRLQYKHPPLSDSGISALNGDARHIMSIPLSGHVVAALDTIKFLLYVPFDGKRLYTSPMCSIAVHGKVRS